MNNYMYQQLSERASLLRDFHHSFEWEGNYIYWEEDGEECGYEVQEEWTEQFEEAFPTFQFCLITYVEPGEHQYTLHVKSQKGEGKFEVSVYGERAADFVYRSDQLAIETFTEFEDMKEFFLSHIMNLREHRLAFVTGAIQWKGR